MYQFDELLQDPKSQASLYSNLFVNLSTSCVHNGKHCPSPCDQYPCRYPEVKSTGKCRNIIPSVSTNQKSYWNLASAMVDYKCECLSDSYHWDGVSRTCDLYPFCEVDEPCVKSNTQSCRAEINNGKHYKCVCKRNFEGEQCETLINVCFRNLTICGDHGHCEMIQRANGNTLFTHKCICRDGWSSDPENPIPNCDISNGAKKGKTMTTLFLPLIPIAIVVVCCCAFCGCRMCQGCCNRQERKKNDSQLMKQLNGDLPVKQNDVTNVQQQAVSPLPAPPAKQDQIKDHGNKRKRKKRQRREEYFEKRHRQISGKKHFFDASNLGLLLIDEDSQNEQEPKSEKDTTSHLYLTSAATSRSSSVMNWKILKTFFENNSHQPIKTEGDDQTEVNASLNINGQPKTKKNSADLYQNFKEKWISAKTIVEKRRGKEITESEQHKHDFD